MLLLVGIFPIPGVTTVPVMVAIFLFRLNPVAAMLTNYLCTPLNLASLPLFMCVSRALLRGCWYKAYSNDDEPCSCVFPSYYGNSFFGGDEGAGDFSVSKFMEVCFRVCHSFYFS